MAGAVVDRKNSEFRDAFVDDVCVRSEITGETSNLYLMTARPCGLGLPQRIIASDNNRCCWSTMVYVWWCYYTRIMVLRLETAVVRFRFSADNTAYAAIVRTDRLNSAACYLEPTASVVRKHRET